MIYCIPLDEATEEFYASVARAAGLPIEQVLRDTLFKLAGELALQLYDVVHGWYLEARGGEGGPGAGATTPEAHP